MRGLLAPAIQQLLASLQVRPRMKRLVLGTGLTVQVRPPSVVLPILSVPMPLLTFQSGPPTA